MPRKYVRVQERQRRYTCAADYHVSGPNWGKDTTLPAGEVKLLLHYGFLELFDRLERNGQIFRAQDGELREVS
jgi:hypothetical protein